MKSTTTASRLAIGMCGTVVGAYCAYTAFRNGQLLASGLDGIAFGSAFAAVVVGSWFLLPLAAQSPNGRAALMRLGWALCLAFVLINAIGFTATHRTEVVGSKAGAITAYDTALAGLSQARERITAMKANARWTSTSGCTDATVAKSIAFCDAYTAEKATADSYQALVSAGKPATADAQADTIAWVMQADSLTVARAMPIFMAVVLDIAASLFIWAALTVYATPIQKSEAKQEIPKPAKAKKGIRKQPKDWTKIDAYQPVFTTKIDRRRKRAKPVNDNVSA